MPQTNIERNQQSRISQLPHKGRTVVHARRAVDHDALERLRRDGVRDPAEGRRARRRKGHERITANGHEWARRKYCKTHNENADRDAPAGVVPIGRDGVVLLEVLFLGHAGHERCISRGRSGADGR